MEQDWDSGAWENTYRSVFEYNAGNRVTMALFQIRDGAAWENEFRYINGYDTNNKWISYLDQDWESGTWANSLKVDISEAQFDPKIDFEFGSLFHYYQVYEWDDALGAWENDSRYFGYFEEFVGAPALPENTDIRVYPNPSDGAFYLAFDATGQPAERFTVTDLTGRQLVNRRLQGIAQEPIELGDLPAGQYFLQVFTKNGTSSVLPVHIR